MKILNPFVPHLSHECLEQLGMKDINIWPKADNNLTLDEKIKIAIQINGKTRQLIEDASNLSENDLVNLIKKDTKLSKYIPEDSEIKKIIFAKNVKRDALNTTELQKMQIMK